MDVNGDGTATDMTGDSPYTEGTVVNIEATPGAGYEFQRWTTDPDGVGLFADAFDPNTTFTMPAQDVTVIANFFDYERRERDADHWAVDQSGSAGITIDTWDISGVNLTDGATIDFLFGARSLPVRFSIWYGDDLIFVSGWVSIHPGLDDDPPYTGGVQAHDWHDNVELTLLQGWSAGIYSAIITYEDGKDEIRVRAEGISPDILWDYRLQTTPNG